MGKSPPHRASGVFLMPCNVMLGERAGFPRASPAPPLRETRLLGFGALLATHDVAADLAAAALATMVLLFVILLRAGTERHGTPRSWIRFGSVQAPGTTGRGNGAERSRSLYRIGPAPARGNSKAIPCFKMEKIDNRVPRGRYSDPVPLGMDRRTGPSETANPDARGRSPSPVAPGRKEPTTKQGT